MDDLDALENQLRARAEHVDAANRSAAEALRPRVLAAMRSAAAQRQRAATPLWVFASGAAAAVVLLANMAFSAAQARPLVVAQVNETRAVAAELRRLLPELDEREAFRQALLLQARDETAGNGLQQIQHRPFSISNADAGLEK